MKTRFVLEIKNGIYNGIYFVRSLDRIKIGVSVDIPRRVEVLRRINAYPLELLMTMEGSYEEEQRLHLRFIHLRAHGEWFRAEPELLEFIAEASNG